MTMLIVFHVCWFMRKLSWGAVLYFVCVSNCNQRQAPFRMLTVLHTQALVAAQYCCGWFLFVSTGNCKWFFDVMWGRTLHWHDVPTDSTEQTGARDGKYSVLCMCCFLLFLSHRMSCVFCVCLVYLLCPPANCTCECCYEIKLMCVMVQWWPSCCQVACEWWWSSCRMAVECHLCGLWITRLTASITSVVKLHL